MRSRSISILVATIVLLAACGSSEDADSPPGGNVPQASAVSFAYSYEPGDHHDYAFTLEQDLDMAVEAVGGEGLLGQEPPADVKVSTSVAGTISYDIAAGRDPGTHQISISGVFDQLSVDGTVDGEPVEDQMLETGAVPNLIEVPNLTIVVDDRGHLVKVDGISEDTPFFGDPFSELGDFTTGGLGGHFGPAFPERPLRIGETWSVTQSQAANGLATKMSVVTTYEVAATEQLGGREVAVIEFTANTSEVVVDLGETLKALFESFGEIGEELGGDTPDPSTEMPEIVFLITVAPSTATGTVWFDRESGVVAKVDQDTATNISMVMDFPDEGGATRTTVKMDLYMQLAAELLEGSSA